MKEKLEMGDKLVCIQSVRWTSFTRYKFASVERLTKTQAILSNGVRLKNEKTYNYDKVICFREVGASDEYQFVTLEILKEAEIAKKEINSHNWFSKKDFTNEEKVMIYEYFKSLNKL